MMLRSLINRIEYHTAADKLRLAAMRLQQWQRKYSPDQPRAPAGQPSGGQWIPWDRQTATPYDGPGRVLCDDQYNSDMFQCRFAVSPRYRGSCRAQAMVRYVACLKDDPIPPFNYYLADNR